MSRDINEATVLGTISKPVQMASGKSGISIANIPLSTTKKGWNGGKDQVTFHTVVCFGELADMAEGCSVGDRIMAKGRIQNDSYTTPEGENRVKTKITASQLAKCLAEGNDEPRSAPAPKTGDSSANFHRGESSPKAAFPFYDTDRDVNWNKPKTEDNGYSFVTKGAFTFTCAWIDADKPSMGGSVFSMTSGDTEWKPAGEIPGAKTAPPF
jgi:single-stranded DNA-binding protein